MSGTDCFYPTGDIGLQASYFDIGSKNTMSLSEFPNEILLQVFKELNIRKVLNPDLRCLSKRFHDLITPFVFEIFCITANKWKNSYLDASKKPPVVLNGFLGLLKEALTNVGVGIRDP